MQSALQWCKPSPPPQRGPPGLQPPEQSVNGVKHSNFGMLVCKLLPSFLCPMKVLWQAVAAKHQLRCSGAREQLVGQSKDRYDMCVGLNEATSTRWDPLRRTSNPPEKCRAMRLPVYHDATVAVLVTAAIVLCTPVSSETKNYLLNVYFGGKQEGVRLLRCCYPPKIQPILCC